jgi:hypothetical protein
MISKVHNVDIELAYDIEAFNIERDVTFDIEGPTLDFGVVRIQMPCRCSLALSDWQGLVTVAEPGPQTRSGRVGRDRDGGVPYAAGSECPAAGILVLLS